ncbi:MAG: nucleotidyltransferase domain-containing protein [Chloroflexi bacterium]|nr:nucleotidyltransferase domain-containing protein [Chloroflexota bacterium]
MTEEGHRQARGTEKRLRGSTRFWRNLRRGPWPEPTVRRLVAALDDLTRQLRVVEGVVGLLLFGSYARGDFGRKSDMDLLVLVVDQPPVAQTSLRQIGRRVDPNMP